MASLSAWVSAVNDVAASSSPENKSANVREINARGRSLRAPMFRARKRCREERDSQDSSSQRRMAVTEANQRKRSSSWLDMSCPNSVNAWRSAGTAEA